MQTPVLSRPTLQTLALFGGLVALAVASRFLHLNQPNMSAVAACALFAGFLFRNRLLALLVPLAAMLLSDALIGGHHPAVMVAVYASLLLPVFFRPIVANGRNPIRIGAAALLGSVVFYLTTNLAHWAATDMYTKNLGGLLESYTQALPFFRYTLQGDLAYAAILFTGYAVATLPLARRTPAAATA